MTNPTLEAARRTLTDHEQMLDAQAGCLPCKLCGGSAVITDAGTGAGYYIRCGNSVTFRDGTGCLINERRLGGWAYNVMDWWNRLHGLSALAPPAAPVTEEGAREVLAEELKRQCGIGAGTFTIDDGYGQSGLWIVNADLDSGSLIRAMLTFAARASSERERRLVEAVDDALKDAYNEHGAQGYGRDTPAMKAVTVALAEVERRFRAALGGTDAE